MEQLWLKTIQLINHLTSLKSLSIVECKRSQNKSNLESQAQRLEAYCCAKGYSIVRVVKEVGSGVNDHRQKLTKL